MGQTSVSCVSRGVEIAGTRRATTPSLELELPSGADGADIACDGSLITPEGVAFAQASVRVVGPTRAPAALSESTSERPSRWPLVLGIGAGAVLVAGVVVAAVVLAGRPDHATLGAPRFAQ
jgi:hypothetical protein